MNLTRIQVSDQIYLATNLSDPLDHVHQAILEKAFNTSSCHIECLCLTTPIPLGVKRSRVKNRFYLQPFHENNAVHADNCSLRYEPYFQEWSEAFQKSDDGFNIKLVGSLTRCKREGGELPFDTDIANLIDDRIEQNRGAVLLELLHFLWSHARLNHWHPHRQHGRTWTTVSFAIEDFIKDESLLINDQFNLESRLTISRRPNEQPVNNEYPELKIKGLAYDKACFVLGELLSIRPAKKDGYMVKLKFMHYSQVFHLPSSMADRIFKSYSKALAIFSRNEHRNITFNVLIKAYKFNRYRRNARMTISDMAIMMTNKQFIPVVDEADAQLALDLVRAQRRFVKPLGTERVGFVLLDTVEPQLITSNVKLPNISKEAVSLPISEKLKLTPPANLISIDEVLDMAIERCG